MGRSIHFFLKESTWGRICTDLNLSHRESEVVLHVVRGLSEPEIAETLGISTHTVHSHMERIFRKLSVKSRAELVARTFEQYAAIVDSGV